MNKFFIEKLIEDARQMIKRTTCPNCESEWFRDAHYALSPVIVRICRNCDHSWTEGRVDESWLNLKDSFLALSEDREVPEGMIF